MFGYPQIIQYGEQVSITQRAGVESEAYDYTFNDSTNNDDIGCLKDRKRTNQTSGHRHLKSSRCMFILPYSATHPGVNSLPFQLS